MDATTAMLVEGAFLLLDGGFTAQQGEDVVNSVLLAGHVAAQAAAPDATGYAAELRQALGNIGWTTTDLTRDSTQLDCGDQPDKTGRFWKAGKTGGTSGSPECVPLTIIGQALARQLTSDLADQVVAGVSALQTAGPQVRQAWAPASRTGPPSCLLFVATLTGGVPMLAYNYNQLTPGTDATGYPWSAVTEPGTLAQFSGSAAMNRMVFTTAFSGALAAKVAPLRPTAVVPLHT
ncbi:hypothetical protein [Nonomuraea sp. NPDC049758]|uniref:hypothetical protein n=1 Tax=Nonomuraea sp. NPDC049758 TaxID=3154360 RepID=UPI00343E2A55